VDLSRVAELEAEELEIRVSWLISPLAAAQPPSAQMLCQVTRPVTAAYTPWFRAPEHTVLLRRIAIVGRFLLGPQPSADANAMDAWVMDGRLPSTVQAAFDRW